MKYELLKFKQDVFSAEFTDYELECTTRSQIDLIRELKPNIIKEHKEHCNNCLENLYCEELDGLTLIDY